VVALTLGRISTRPPPDDPAGMARFSTPTRRLVAAGSAVAAIAIAAGLALAASRDIGSGAWSYFGDPRSVYHAGKTFTGWIGRRGEVVVASIERRTGETHRTVVRRFLSVDDHNNPSLIVRPDGRILVFYTPHSGKKWPPRGVRRRMYYRLSRRPGDISRFGPERSLRTNTPGGLGYTYPNPVQLARGKLWLFWRGGNWQPSFSTSRDGRRWSRARTLVQGLRRQRPYIKYEGNRRDTIHFTFSPAHPKSRPTSLYYARYRNRRFFRADGMRIATLRGLPIHFTRADRVYNVGSGGGRAWPHDIAIDENNRPVIVYTRRRNGGRGPDIFHYVRWTGNRWDDQRIVSAGEPRGGYTSGGITLDHENPNVVYLSRRISGANEVEVWVTADGGRTWASRAITHDSDVSNIRPVSPRGLIEGNVILWMGGHYMHYRRYPTSIIAHLEDEAKAKAGLLPEARPEQDPGEQVRIPR
jgi:hypothetical protein